MQIYFLKSDILHYEATESRKAETLRKGLHVVRPYIFSSFNLDFAEIWGLRIKYSLHFGP
jgi:hypothetical protein